MFGTTHHNAFDKWWEYAAENYVTWEKDKAVALDLYYDPVVDEHVGRGPMGIIAPAWYFAPQRNQVAEMGWQTVAQLTGALGDGPIMALDQPAMATMLLQITGEFADAATKEKIWAQADDHIQPTWDRATGEFTLGLGLNEAHPRGQLNARMMAGWVCTPGAWSRIFNEPNLTKFDEPTITHVDFPRVALSEAKWDGVCLHLAAHAQNADIKGTKTTMRLTNIASSAGWVMTTADGEKISLKPDGQHVDIEILVDNRVVNIQQG